VTRCVGPVAGVGVVGGAGVELVGVVVGVGVGDDGDDTLTEAASTVNNVALAAGTELLVFSVVLALLTAVANFVEVKFKALWLATAAAAESEIVAVNVILEFVRRAAAAVEATDAPLLKTTVTTPVTLLVVVPFVNSSEVAYAASYVFFTSPLYRLRETGAVIC
jgi:hypothetical protein